MVTNHLPPSPPNHRATNPPDHRSHRCQWCLSHHPPRTSDPPEPPTTKPIGLARLTPPPSPWYLSHRATDHQGGKATGASLTNHQPPGARAIDPPTLPIHQTTGATNHHQGVWLTNHQSTGLPEPPSTGVTGSWVTGLPPSHQIYRPTDSPCVKAIGSLDCQIHYLPSPIWWKATNHQYHQGHRFIRC
jgi:hypothetical protein